MHKAHSRLGARLAVTALATLATLPSVAAPVDAPEAFVRRVYARYRASGPGVLLTRPGGTPYYTVALLDEIAKDEAFANGEIRAIDSDPLCGCQDHDDIKLGSVVISSVATDTVKARVTFRNFGKIHTVVLTLLQTSGGWRIADVGQEGIASLMAYLRESNAQPAERPPAPDKAPSTRP